jgi:hypothetical protein
VGSNKQKGVSIETESEKREFGEKMDSAIYFMFFPS